MRWRFLILACGLWCGHAGTCWADETEAKERFQRAQEAYQGGRFERAAELFEEANSLAPRAQVKYNAGIAWDHAGKPARSALAYEIALNMGGLVEDQAEAARDRLSTLRSQLGYLRINEPIGALVSVDYLEQQPVPVVAYLEPGSYRVDVNYQNHPSTQLVHINAGETQTLALELSARPPPPNTRVLDETPDTLRSPDASQETLGWIGVGVGVALGGLATYLGTRTLAARDEFVQDDTDPDKRRRAERLQTQTNLAWGGAAVTGIGGAVLLLTSPTFEF